MKSQYDAIIVGGGHNGLVCGAYLARAGAKVCVLERRSIAGGAAVSEEIWPGYKFSTASYYMGLLQPKVILDLELRRYGFDVLTAPPTVFALSGGRHFTLWDDPERMRAEIGQFSNADAVAYDRYRAHMRALKPFMQQLLFEIPVNPASGKVRDLRRLAGFVWRFRKIGLRFYDIYNLLTMSAYDYLGRWFSSEEVKLALGFFAGGGGGNSSLKQPGSAYMLARGIVRDTDTPAGPVGFVKGGMGSISDAIRRSGEAHGMEVRTDSEVSRILIDGGHACGVELCDGHRLYSRIVIANTAARTVFTKLVPEEHQPEEFRRDLRAMRTESTVFRLNLGLTRLPQAPTFPARPDCPFPVQLTIADSVDYMEEAHMDARRGEMSERPFLIVKTPSVVDPTLAPRDRHVMNIMGGHAPYTLKKGDWATRRTELMERAMAVLRGYFPDIDECIEHSMLYTPVDFERIFDLPNGHVHHGEISADQMFFRRPASGYADYRTPVEGLYLASASVHPGGGVTGMPGHNAARVILEDRADWRARA